MGKKIYSEINFAGSNYGRAMDRVSSPCHSCACLNVILFMVRTKLYGIVALSNFSLIFSLTHVTM